ncbi:hypothetical protein BGZ65_000994, partial [Modicella reniformis]
MQVKGSTTLDHAILPMKSTIGKLHGQEHEHEHKHNEYFNQHQPRQDQFRNYDRNASSAHSDSRQHSRIDIANLLCSSESIFGEDGRKVDQYSQRKSLHRQDLGTHSHHHHQRPRAITEEADDRDVPSHTQYGN